MNSDLGFGRCSDDGGGSKGDGRGEVGEASKGGDRSGVKRSYEENGGELVSNCESVVGGSESVRRGKKIKGFERSDDVMEDKVNESIGVRVTDIEEGSGDNASLIGNLDEKEVGANGNLGKEVLGEEFDAWENWDLGLRIEGGNEKGNLGKLEKLGPDSGDCRCNCMDVLISKSDFDLNEPFWDAAYGASGIDFQDLTIGSRVAKSNPEVIVVSSDDEDEDDNFFIARRDDRGKSKVIENGSSQDSTQGRLVIPERYWDADVNSSVAAQRRYTREEKGKGKVVESFVSPATDPNLLELFPEEPGLPQPVVSQVPVPRFDPLRDHKERRAENVIKFRESAKSYASEQARMACQAQKHLEETWKKNQELAISATKSNVKLEDFPGPFSSALKALRKRNGEHTAQRFIEWKPLEQQNSKILTPFVPSLLDLSLRALAKNSEAIVSLDHVPYWLRQRFTTMLCDARKMNSHVLNLLLRDAPAEIRVKDCSWLTDAQAGVMFGKLDAKNLRVLQLDLFGKCAIEDNLYQSLIQSLNSLMWLRIVSLRGACRLTDDLLRSLVTSAPLLQSVNVGQSSLLTSNGIMFLADSLAASLRELYIDDCQKIDAMCIIESLKKFQHLEVLSVAGIESVCDAFVYHIFATGGGNMKELDLADCGNVTDLSLEVIGKHCPELQSLNISNLNKLTDFGLLYLANGCQSIRTLKCCRNGFSDDAIAAFVETSGQSLKELSLNGVSKAGPSTALSLAKHSRKLSILDLSWCRWITNEAMGLIVDCCLSLKLLKIFGCTQITEKFLRGHSNPLVHIVGTNTTPILERVHMFESKEIMLRYSPLSDGTY